MADAERTSLAAAIALSIATLIGLAILALREPDRAAAVLAQWAAHAVLGKETGIPVGLAAGNPPPIVFFAGAALDALILLGGYPLVMALARGALRVPRLRRFASRLDRPASPPRHALVGMPLLAGSLWIPFLPSGALAAMIIGRAARYPAHALLGLLVLSIVLAHLAYVMLAASAFDHARSSALLWASAVLMALMSLAVAFWARRKAASERPRP